MLYLIAALLLILVLANENAHAILFVLVAGAGGLAVIGGVLYGLFLLSPWLFPGRRQSEPVAVSSVPGQVDQWDLQNTVGFIVALILAALFFGGCLYGLAKEGRRDKTPPY